MAGVTGAPRGGALVQYWRNAFARREVAVLATALALMIVLNLVLIPWRPWSDSIIGLWVSPTDVLHQLLEGWTPRTLLGWDTGWGLTFLPLALVVSSMHAIGLPFWLCERLWISALLIGAAVGVFLFLGRMFPGWRLGRTAGAVLYVANPYVWVTGRDGSALLLPYVLVPFLLVALLRCRDAKRPVVAGIGLGVLSVGLVGISPSASLLALDLIAAFAIFVWVRSTREQRQMLARVAVVAVPVALGVNLWWILPETGNLLFHIDTAAKAVETPIGDDRVASFTTTARLVGNSGIFSGWNGAPYYQDLPLLQNPLVRFVSLLLPVFAICGLAAGIVRRRASSVFWLIVAALSWVASVGAHVPTGSVFLNLLNHIPGSIAFRSGFRMASVLVFAYVVGVGMAVEELFPYVSRLAACSKKVASAVITGMPALLIGSILCTGLPMWLGHLEPVAKTFSIPTYWYQAAKWLNAAPGYGRILYLPPQGYSVYSWGQPMGEPALNLVHKPAVIDQPGQSAGNQIGSQLVTSLVWDLANGNANGEAEFLLHLLDVKYVIERGDYNWQYYDEPSPTSVLHTLSANPNLRLVRRFGALNIYDVKGAAIGAAWVVENAMIANGPLVVANTTVGPPTWAHSRVDVPVPGPQGNIEINAQLQIMSGAHVGVGIKGINGSGYVVAELRSDGSRIEAWPMTSQATGGPVAMSNFLTQVGVSYDVRFLRVGNSVSLFINGQLIASGTTTAAGEGKPYVVAFQSQVEVSAFTVKIPGGATLYSLPRARVGGAGVVPPGWVSVRGNWGLFRNLDPAAVLYADAGYSRSLGALSTVTIFPGNATGKVKSLSGADAAGVPHQLTRALSDNGSAGPGTGSATSPGDLGSVGMHAHVTSFVQHGASALAKVTANRPFLLVLGQTYDPNWTASVNGRMLPAKDHFEAYGFANAWFVPTAGHIVVSFVYTPQAMYRDLQYVSLVCMVFIGVALLVIWRRGAARG